MLGKLIKYDLKYVYKQLLIFYAIIFACAIVARLTDANSHVFIIKFIHEFAQGCVFGFGFGSIINASMRIWARLRLNFYGAEAYLTHTLPVSRHLLWASKFLSSLIIAATSLIVCLLAILIMFSSEDFITEWGLDDPATLKLFLIFGLTILCQVIYIIQSGLTGIVLGHRHNYSRLVYSVVYGIALYLVSSFVIMALAFLWAQFDPAVHALIFDGAVQTPTVINRLLLGIIAAYVVLIATTYIINDRLLARGVNVD